MGAYYVSGQIFAQPLRVPFNLVKICHRSDSLEKKRAYTNTVQEGFFLHLSSQNFCAFELFIFAARKCLFFPSNIVKQRLDLPHYPASILQSLCRVCFFRQYMQRNFLQKHHYSFCEMLQAFVHTKHSQRL